MYFPNIDTFAGRILAFTSNVENKILSADKFLLDQIQKDEGTKSEENRPKGFQLSSFLPTSRRIVQFSNGKV